MQFERVRWSLRSYDEERPHLDKRILTGRTDDGRVASAAVWGWSYHRTERQYAFAKVRRILKLEAERRLG